MLNWFSFNNFCSLAIHSKLAQYIGLKRISISLQIMSSSAGMKTSIEINDDSEQTVDEFPGIDSIVLTEFVSKELLLKSFYLHFFIIFLMPVLNLIVAMPSLYDSEWPLQPIWLSIGVSAANSLLIFKSYEDIYHPLEYEAKKKSGLYLRFGSNF